MNLPEHVPVMPLPNAILFPRVLLPLYIFEPRYKEMLADCLAGDRMFAVALLRKGWEHEGHNPTPYDIACVGMIRTCVGRPDGTSNLVLEGVTRVSIHEYVRVRPYRIARVKPLSSAAGKSVEVRPPLISAVTQLADARAKMGSQLPDGVLESMRTITNGDYLSDLISYMMLESFHEKQLMLETLDGAERQRVLVELLERQIRQFELWKNLQGTLPNENIGHN
jgi:Lon protease-like protein